MQFKKATKSQARGRIALMGPAGSGKTYTALQVASVMAKMTGKRIAAIDSERGSMSLYADKFDFDVLELDSFAPANYVKAIHAAEEAGYGVIVVDSLSHAWMGKDGALEMVSQEQTRQRTQNSYTAWRNVTPEHNALVDAMLRSQCHIVATLRTKVEYVQEKDDKGKSVVRKVGLAPVQRDGLEYEFTLVGDIDTDHTMTVTKSRCDTLADRVIKKPGVEFATELMRWLSDGAPIVERPRQAAPIKSQPTAPTDGEVAPKPESSAPVRDIMATVKSSIDAATNDAELTEVCQHYAKQGGIDRDTLTALYRERKAALAQVA